MTRGPKSKTARNSRYDAPGRIQHESVVPTSALTDSGKEEFWRLVGVLDSRGSLDRVDLSVLTECARIKDQIDRLYVSADAESAAEVPLALSGKTIQLITMLTSQRRGLLRELGLTIKPSNTVVKTIAKDGTQADPIAAKIKLHG